MITLHQVSKRYAEKDNVFQALHDINLEIPTGATVAIIGKSGSGKSTLMHIMSGLDRPSEGSVMIDGKDIATLRSKAIDTFRATQMSFIFQSFFVEANQTCYRNISLPLEITRTPQRKRKALIERALQAVDLADKADTLAGNLSGGQKQRLAIARAIVHGPQLLFADEPTGNLDSVTGEKVMQLLLGLNARLGCTLILVTHDNELAKRCQMQVRLKDGVIEAITGTTKDKGRAT